MPKYETLLDIRKNCVEGEEFNGSKCWLWRGPFRGKGAKKYGRVRDGKDENAHRWAWALAKFYDDPEAAKAELRHLREYSMEMGHLCGVSTCVNPDHVRPISSRRNRTEQLQQEKIRTAKESPSIPGMPEPLPKPPDPVELLDGYYHALLSGKGIEQALLALRVRVQEDVQRRLS